MTLTEYLRAQKLTHAEFAVRIGATQAAVTRYANGRRKPSLDKIIVIERETRGLVRAVDFVPQAAEIDADGGVCPEVPLSVGCRRNAGFKPGATGTQSR